MCWQVGPEDHQVTGLSQAVRLSDSCEGRTHPGVEHKMAAWMMNMCLMAGRNATSCQTVRHCGGKTHPGVERKMAAWMMNTCLMAGSHATNSRLFPGSLPHSSIIACTRTLITKTLSYSRRTQTWGTDDGTYICSSADSKWVHE